MMKAICEIDGKKSLILGLSHKNLARLKEDGLRGAVRIDGSAIGLSHDIYLTAAETERDLLKAFEPNIGPGTKLNIDKRFTD